MASKAKTSTRLAARYIDNDLVLSGTHAWTYLRIPAVSYEYLTDDDRVHLAVRMHLALGALVTGTDTVDVHLIGTSRPYDVDTWAEVLHDRVSRYMPAPGWGDFLADSADYLSSEEYLRKEVYIGVCLGPRKGRGAAKPESLDLFGPLKKLAGRAETLMDLEDDLVPDSELEHWRGKAAAIQRSLAQSHLKAVPATPNEVAWLIAKPLHPAMPCPPPSTHETRPWGPGEVQSLAEGLVRNGHKFLTVEQDDPDNATARTGYTATLALSRFPDVLDYPDQEPWLYFAKALAFDVDFFTRMTLVPATKVQKDVGRKLAEAKDQATHIAETGANIPLEIQEQYSRATALEFTINKDRVPWAYARHRLVVTATSEAELRARVQAVVEHYRDLAIDVVWPTGDQLDLLCEAQPGDGVRSKAYFQRQELMLVAGGMPHASSEVGDKVEKGRGWIGPYLGYTTSRVRTVVNFAPHVAMARNFPPGVAITGAPGGGKSFLAFNLTYQMAVQGVWTIYIDPKADALPLADLPGLGKSRLVDLRHGHDGILDPFSLGENARDGVLLAIETLKIFAGSNMSDERESALIDAVEAVASQPAPSLYKVVDHLRNSPDISASALGRVLTTLRDLPFARLCFAPQGDASIRPEDGLTVITLLGLAPMLPVAGTNSAEYTVENRLAVSVMALLTRYARGLMLSLNKSHPKALCIDEAWAIAASPQGAKLIPEVARMGRSHNTALVLVSQNAGDLDKQSITNSMSTFFCFRSKNADEITDVLKLLGMANTEANREAIKDLNEGECLMKDIDGRLARVQIDSWNAALFEAFNTNPETRGQAQAVAA